MSEILLAKPKLPEGWIDFSVGEPHVVREKFMEIFGFDKTYFTFTTCKGSCEYPPPNGYGPLVKLLEEKHGAPVVITNGAKQALGASFYAMKRIGKSKLGMRTPYWALIPPLAEVHGLQCTEKYDCYLAIWPNNPDGYMVDYEYAKYLADFHRRLNIPFIHDAAYYTHTYLPDDYKLGPLGDMQIFSISKMFGISGLRLGYIVFHNTEYYKYIQEYMETMTVGVSVASQMILHNILSVMNKNPELERRFLIESRDALYKAKFLSRLFHKDILEIPNDVEHVPGMFGWFKIGPRCDFKRARIHTVDGALFGGPGMVRINLGLNAETLTEAIHRLNSL
jgi:aspartate/methionine/tyrosine aminotransferase